MPARISFFTGVVFLAAAKLFAAGSIPDIESQDELAKLTPIHLASGWDIRLGIADAGETLGQGRMIYCLASNAGPTHPQAFESRLDHPGDQIGPVVVHVQWQNNLRDMMKSMQSEPAHNGIYGRFIPMTRQGTCRVFIETDDGAPIVDRDFEFKEKPVVYWQNLARYHQGSELETDNYACVPRYVISPEANPTTQPAAAPVTIDLSIDSEIFPAKIFLVKATGGKIPERAADSMLARWWVNGKPVVPPISTKISQRAFQQGQQMSGRVSDAVALPFGLPADLGDIKAGDTVAIQVLSCPDGWQMVTEIEMVMLQTVRVSPSKPLLSNRLEFTVTPEMLAERTAVTVKQ